MQADLTNLLPLMLGFLIVGIIGITFWVAWMIFKARYKEQLQTSAIADAITPSFSVVSRDVHLLALNHTPGGKWEITINGKPYSSLEAVPDDSVRQDIVAGLKELVAFARSYVQKDQVAKKPLAPDSPMPPAEKPLSPATPVSDKRRVFLKGEQTLKRPDAIPMLMPSLDLAREIGEIVAEMQAGIPSLAQRSIKLQDAPDGGVCFAIDGIVYFDVNEIPDADIQALIRAATKEWERR